MSDTNAAAEVAGRLRAIDWVDWDSADEHAASRATLLREYLRRSAIWAEDLGATDEWPFFDIAARVDPAVRAPSELVEELADFTSENVPAFKSRKLCEFAVQWAALDDAAPDTARRHVDPFEPLLLLFERGGVFVVENGVVDFATLRVPIGTCQSHLSPEPVTGLAPEELDVLDKQP